MPLAEMLAMCMNTQWSQADPALPPHGPAKPTPQPNQPLNGNSSSTQISAADGKPFPLMKLPYDLRRRIYEVIYLTNSTIYLTMGSQAIRHPPPVNFRVEKAFLNFLRCCRKIKDEVYEVLYRTNKFVLNPLWPDLQFCSDAPYLPVDGKLQCFWDAMVSAYKDAKAQGRDVSPKSGFLFSAGFLPTDKERGQGNATQKYQWYSRFCFLTYMSPATCAIVRELQIFLGDAEWILQQVPPSLFCSPALPHFPRVVVTSIPLFHGSISSRRVFGRIRREWQSIPLSIQAEQRSRLREARQRIARERAGEGITVWDNLGQSSCGGFLMEAGPDRFIYENLPENRRWLEGYVHHHLEGRPVRAALLATRSSR
ncbi:MAG: hypothetical protein Q9212_006140 [Teloschistes hypoglaucus]